MTLENFNENLKKYARLIAETGVNVQDNHTVVLQISVDQAPLARLITASPRQSFLPRQSAVSP